MIRKLSAEVEQKGDILEFKLENFIGGYSIFYSKDNQLNDKTLLLKSSSEFVEIESPDNCNRLFFSIIDKSNDEVVISTRKVDVNSIDNFRDLGGYKTKDGKRVKWGYFYRCASLANMDSRDKEYLERMGIKTVFDFRSEIEVKSEQDIIPNNAIYINESGIQEMDETFKGNNNFDMKSLLMNLSDTPKRIGEITDFLVNGYKNMAIKNEAFKKFFDVIKDEDRVPLVFHCTAGKDRTGVGGALILLALGVPEEKVIEDYSLSNLYRKEVNEKQLGLVKQFIKDEEILNIINDLFIVKEDYIRVTLDSIKERYISYEEYIINELGVSKKELDELKEKYLY